MESSYTRVQTIVEASEGVKRRVKAEVVDRAQSRGLGSFLAVRVPATMRSIPRGGYDACDVSCPEIGVLVSY